MESRLDRNCTDLYKICLKPPLMSSQFYFIRKWAGATLFGQVCGQEALRASRQFLNTDGGTHSQSNTQKPTCTVTLHLALLVRAQRDGC